LCKNVHVVHGFEGGLSKGGRGRKSLFVCHDYSTAAAGIRRANGGCAGQEKVGAIAQMKKQTHLGGGWRVK
jgi:hypothetical protein